MKKTLLSALVAGVLAAGMTGQASAVATEFYFDAYGGFSGAQSGFPLPEWYVANSTGGYQHLHWGTPQGDVESSLSINLVNPDDLANIHNASNYNMVVQNQINVGSDPGTVIGSVVHFNQPINETVDLALAEVQYYLKIFSDAARSNLVWNSGMMTFTLEEWETLNYPSGPCPEGNVPCADRLRYAAGYPNPPTGNVFDQTIGSFVYDGVNYIVDMNGFWDQNVNLVGTFWSPEDQWSRMDVRAEIHVPEPASMALMGLGLIGLGLARRYRNKV